MDDCNTLFKRQVGRYMIYVANVGRWAFGWAYSQPYRSLFLNVGPLMIDFVRVSDAV